jgi:hypothetical protein
MGALMSDRTTILGSPSLLRSTFVADLVVVSARSTFCGALLGVFENGLSLGDRVVARRLFRGPTVRAMGHGLRVRYAV